MWFVGLTAITEAAQKLDKQSRLARSSRNGTGHTSDGLETDLEQVGRVRGRPPIPPGSRTAPPIPRDTHSHLQPQSQQYVHSPPRGTDRNTDSGGTDLDGGGLSYSTIPKTTKDNFVARRPVPPATGTNTPPVGPIHIVSPPTPLVQCVRQ